MLLREDVLRFLLYGERSSLMSHNKEGLFSVIGFYCIFLFALQIRRQNWDWKQYGLASIFSGVLSFLLHSFVQQTSRRLANAAYVFFVVSMNCYLLCCLLFVEERFQSSNSITEAISRNQLLVFLFANVTTGVINLSIESAKVSATSAVLILYGYGISVVFCAKMLQFLKKQ